MSFNVDPELEALLRSSGLFDAEWYCCQYPDVPGTEIDPLWHFLWLGMRLGRQPGPEFDPQFYLASYPDVAGDGVDPLVHYLRFGREEGRICKPAAPVANGQSFQLPETERYAAWLAVNAAADAAERRLNDALAAAESLPRISVIMPVYQPPLGLLQEAVDSLFAQIYGDWELCIHVDGDQDLALQAWLRGLETRDSRVRLSFGQRNGGISDATNQAAKLATGDFLAFFDQDDLLTRPALASLALALAERPDADIAYSDDDKIDVEGNRYAPQFKPGWAPVLLLSYMYMSHLFCVRRSLFEELGGFRVGFEGSQDYDFALRASERVRHVVHVPDVLYHWRAVPGSTAVSGEAKPASFTAGLRAVQEACSRRNIKATAIHPEWASQAKIGVFRLLFADVGPAVTIIIPTRNRLDLLKPCIDSIERLTTYENYQLLIVDNESDDPDTLAFLDGCGHEVLRLASPGGKFSFAYLMNRAVEHTNSDMVLLLNNDTLVRNGAWLSQMVGYAQMDGIGAVGAKLYFPDDTIQHAGIAHGFYGDLAGPVFRNAPRSHHGHLCYAMVAREYAAVTAACLLTRRETFLALGGMDEARFAVAYNDVDFCYRIVQSGLSCIYCPEAELTHFEGKSRGFDDNILELANFRSQYRNFQDKWFNPNYSRDDEHLRVRPYRYVLPAVARNSAVRLLMVSHNLNHEGAPNSMFELVRGLRDKGYADPLVISPQDGPLRSSYEEAGLPVQIIDHPLSNGFGPGVFDSRMDLLAAQFRITGAEAVYANTADAFWAIEAASRAGLPCLWNIRESEPWDRYFHRLPEALQASAYRGFYQAYRVIFVANSTRDGWSPLSGRHNFTVIQNGLDLNRVNKRLGTITRSQARRRLGLAAKEIAVIFLGTVCERKNQRVMIKALADMPIDRAPLLRIFIVGDREGPYSQDMHADLAALPDCWRRQVEIVPETDQPYLYFQAGDVAVCASLYESYPRVILEAMSFGLPVVTTKVFGIAEQVKQGVNGLFFDPHRPDELAAALLELVRDPAKRAQFGENSRLLFRGLMQYDDMIDRYGAIAREAAASAAVKV